jgi:hypothetical protein
MPRHNRVFTPTAVEIIRDLAGRGKSAGEIAAAIGSTPASVRVKCCQLKIKVSRRGRPGLSQSRPPRIHERSLIVVPIRSATYAALEQRAARMHKTPVEFAGLLLEAIVNGNLYSALWGDGE